MNFPIGFAIVVGLVLGGFILSGGNLDIILKVLLYESMMIGGMAVGTTIIANSFTVLKQVGGGIVRIIRGERWKKKDYSDALLLLYEIAKIKASKGLQGLDGEAEQPMESELFKKYPRIRNDHFALNLITDTLKAMVMNLDDPHTAEELMKHRLKAHHHHALAPATALSNLADALPAIGIVAAVLGVIKTMGAVDQPPAVLGEKIGGALVGTVLGVFLAYGLVGPLAKRLTQIEEKDAAFYHVISNMLIAIMNNDQALICIERGRSSIPTGLEPTFNEIEALSREIRV